jgi:hypothetical protein
MENNFEAKVQNLSRKQKTATASPDKHSLAYAREARGEYFSMKLTRSRSQYLPCEELIDQGGPPRCVCSAMAALANPCDKGKTPFLTVSVSLRAGSTDGESNVQKELLQRLL